jgi:hypothetical protein
MVFVNNQFAVFVTQCLLARLKIEHKGFVLFIGYWHNAHSPLWKLRWVILIRKVPLHLLGLHVKHLDLGFGLNAVTASSGVIWKRVVERQISDAREL